ncbi:amidohydrolase family protein [Leucobacter insecticola]|uniref:Amidohydrolase family protein n=1 Tax=Leucobacter insecticola TaxID=2714934 RepID=A0A6G8FIU3_9MICO|nr:amidohydrolase family protein [Leucobacter insecticola]QIM16284.1 amidohydrolase family protein [Leucobacter insecticola]
MQNIGQERGRATVFTDGRVVTMRPDNAVHESVVMIDGRVVGTGSEEQMLALAGSGAERVSLSGRTLMPGIIDTHPHLLSWAAFRHSVVDLFDCRDWNDILARIEAAVARAPKGEWIRCSPVGEPHYFVRRSWRDLAEGELPVRDILDAVAPDHPVWIQAWAPVNPNTTVFNTRGLNAIQVSRNTPDRIGNVYLEKDRLGEPTGRFSGAVNNYYNNEPWWDSVLARISGVTGADFMEGAIDGMRAANALGVTSVFEGHMMDFPTIDVYRQHRAAGTLSVRVLCTPDGEPHGLPDSVALSEEELGDRLRGLYALQERTDDFFRVEGLLLTRGGPLGPGQQIFERNYRNGYGAWTNGIEWLPEWKGQFMADFAAERGMRLNVISVADREHETTLRQIHEAERRFGSTIEQNYILQHAYTLSEAHGRRFRDQGFDITTSMSFSFFKQHTYWERMGSQVLRDLIPLRRELDLGFDVSCGSDWGPENVWEHIALAETHDSVWGGNNGGPAQRISRLESLATWTRNGAKVMRWEGIGSLQPGHHADLIVVDRDPLTCSNEELKETQVQLTMLGGKAVYSDGTVGSK